MLPRMPKRVRVGIKKKENSMILKVIKPKDILNEDEANTIRGGINPSYYDEISDCDCDCFGGNKNNTNGLEEEE